MSQSFLRALVWVISLSAISANILVMITSRQKYAATCSLVGHLPFADFWMGMYLLLIASVDLYTRSHYCHYDVAWQTGSGCNSSIFASELSV